MYQSNEISIFLVKSLVQFLVFLEFSDDDVVDPDIAIQEMEKISTELKSLEESKLALLLEDIYQLSTHYDDEKASFLMSIDEYLDLK